MSPARFIPDEGTGDEKLILIGEAPGRQEDRAGRPFVGWSGYRWEEWLEKDAGLRRDQCYITNVYPYRPLNNVIESVPRAKIENWTNDLHERIARLNDPYVIVPTGNTALRALTGKAYFPWESNRRGKDGVTIPGIMSHRGSIYRYVDLNGREIKVIPTIHPAATAKQPGLEKRCRLDWKRIGKEVLTRGIDLPQRTHRIATSPGEVREFIDNIDTSLAIDLEWTDEIILCAGFSIDPSWSFTVPTTMAWWGMNKAILSEIWKLIRQICESGVPKILHHGHSDSYVLRVRNGIRINNYARDTLAEHHCLDASDDHDLAYLASIFTRQPYWKDEAKDPESIKKYSSNYEALLTYNGIDCCVTKELDETFSWMIQERGLEQFYQDHYADLIPELVELMLHGVAVNQQRRRRKYLELTADCLDVQQELTKEVSYSLYGKKSLSAKKVQKFLYDDLRLPKKTRTRKKKDGSKDKTITADEVAIRRLMIETQAREPNSARNVKLQRVGLLILQHRRKAQLKTFFSVGRFDSDDRMRSSYAPYADSGRLRSSANPLDGGSNAQNLDREARDIFVVDR